LRKWENGVDPLMLQEAALHPGGSAKKILLLVQRNQILLDRYYFLCEGATGRMST